MKFTTEEFPAKLPLSVNEKWEDEIYFTTAFRKKNMSLEFFAPRGIDYQTFHEEDEFYFIACGRGELIIGNAKCCCEVGDAFFVPANVFHKFKNFSHDFATWAIFF